MIVLFLRDFRAICTDKIGVSSMVFAGVPGVLHGFRLVRMTFGLLDSSIYGAHFFVMSLLLFGQLLEPVLEL
jgi:hypothetical protein